MLQWSFPLRKIKVLVCTDSLGGSIYIERCMCQDNPVVLSAIVELMYAVESAGQKGGAQYTAYLKTTGKKEIRLTSNQETDSSKSNFIELPRTFVYAVNVLLLCDDSGQTLHQQKGSMVALD